MVHSEGIVVEDQEDLGDSEDLGDGDGVVEEGIIGVDMMKTAEKVMDSFSLHY